MASRTLDSDKSTFERQDEIDKEDQEIQCSRCVYYVPEGKREKNRVTGQEMACSLFGYSEDNLRRECPAMKKEDKGDEDEVDLNGS